MKIVPYLVEQHLSAQALQLADVDTIAINLANLILSPGVAFILQLGGLAQWLNWPGNIIPLLGCEQDFIDQKIQVNEQGVLIKDAQGYGVQITPQDWMLWQYQMGLNQVTPFIIPAQHLSRNKQKMISACQAKWQQAQDEVTQMHQLSLIDLQGVTITDQAVQLALQGRAIVRGQIVNCHDDCWHDDVAAIDTACACPACQHYSRAYLHQMVKHHEAYGVRLLIQHNLMALQSAYQ